MQEALLSIIRLPARGVGEGSPSGGVAVPNRRLAARIRSRLPKNLFGEQVGEGTAHKRAGTKPGQRLWLSAAGIEQTERRKG